MIGGPCQNVTEKLFGHPTHCGHCCGVPHRAEQRCLKIGRNPEILWISVDDLNQRITRRNHGAFGYSLDLYRKISTVVVQQVLPDMPAEFDPVASYNFFSFVEIIKRERLTEILPKVGLQAKEDC